MAESQKGKNVPVGNKKDVEDHGGLLDPNLNTDHEQHKKANISPAQVELKVENPADKGGPAYEEHLLSIDAVALRFGTSVNVAAPMKSLGLTQDQAKLARITYGPNILNPPKSTPAIVIFLKKLFGLLNVLLLLAGVLSFVLYGLTPAVTDNLTLALILVLVAFLNALLDFYQEYKTGSILKSFMKLIPENSTVLREGIQQEIPASELVPGDVIVLKNGCKIPADLRLIFVKGNMKVDNSSLTGESEPQERALIAGNNKPQEAQNLLFNGTLLVSGDGIGIVIRTGNNTMLGGVANLTVGEKKRESRLTKEIDHFVLVLAGCSFVLAACLFGYGFSKTSDISINFGFAISIFVAFVPQGLPGTVTTLLTIGAKRMVKKQALVKDLQGVETLGSITILCSDKTGTLTQNKMSVVGSWINGELLTAYDVLHEYHDDANGKESMKDQKHVENLREIMRASVLCSNARFDEADKSKPSKERRAYGDATEVGLLRYAAKRVDVFSAPDKYPKAFELPFNSENKWHLTINKLPHKNGRFQILVKGAPERVLAMCTHIKMHDQELPLTEKHHAEFQKAYEHYASQGNRVIGFAHLKLSEKDFPKNFEFSKDPKPNFPTSGFVFSGLISLRDPPKKGVKSAVVALRQAGVQVVMVTGDHPLTAVAIAKQVGIVVGKTKEQAAQALGKSIKDVKEWEYEVAVIKGDQVDALAHQDWLNIFSKEEIVFARTLPHQKLKIVKTAQEYGHIVAVSGDGVNDAPALKSADLGISMNKTGADVSKEAAGMILLDDYFPTVVEGVKEGRAIFSNLKKCIRYTLTHSMPEAIPSFMFIVNDVPLFITSFLVLLIDLGTELVPAISLAWEEPEGDLMSYPPRKIVIAPDMLELRRKKESEEPFFKRTCKKVKRLVTTNPLLEVLVDVELLFWVYGQAGLILFGGCCAAFLAQAFWSGIDVTQISNSSACFDKFNTDSWETIDCQKFHVNARTGAPLSRMDAIYAVQSGQTAFYIGIVVSQWFTLQVVKSRYGWPLGTHLFKNVRSWIGIAISVVICVLISYIPSGKDNLGSGPISIGWVAPLSGGIVLVIYEFLRKALLKRGYFGGLPKQIPRNPNLLELKSFDAGMVGGGSQAILSRIMSKANLSQDARKMSQVMREYSSQEIGKKGDAGDGINVNDYPEELRDIVKDLMGKK